jgi:hypothetical protein
LHASRCITARVRRGRCMPRQRHTITCQADDERQLQRTTGGRQPAADTTRQRCGACAQPAADPVQLPAAPHRRIDAALLGSIWRGCSVAICTCTIADRDRIGTRVRKAPSTARTPRQRQYEQHDEHGRTFERVADVCAARRWPSKLMLHWARIVRPMRARSFRYEGCIRTPLARLPSLPDGRSAAAPPCR